MRGGRQRAVDSTGTAEGLLLPLPEPLPAAAGAGSHVSCYPDVVPDGYILSAQVGFAGALVEWLGREAFADLGGDYLRMAAEVPRPLRFRGIVCHPVFGRSASPRWDPAGARGAFLGLTLATTRGELLQAALEASCFSLRANLAWLEQQAGAAVDVLRCVGGATRNELWMQLKADISGRAVEAVTMEEAAALGAALLAGVGVGLHADHAAAAAQVALPAALYEPDERRAASYARVFDQVVAELPGALSQLQLRLAALREEAAA